MTLNSEDIIELKQLYLNRYHIQITDEQALTLGSRLVSLFKVVGTLQTSDPVCGIENNEVEAKNEVI